VDKKRARLSLIRHLLDQIPYREVPHSEVEFPPRVRNPDYSRTPLPKDIYIPEYY